MAKDKKILLIEDEKMLAEMYQTKFKSEGYKIDLAFDGSEGLEAAKAEKPDIILLDIILPKLDGFLVLKELKKEASTKNIPVIMLSNLGQDEDIKKGKKMGATDYFVKANHTPAEIVDKVKEVLGEK